MRTSTVSSSEVAADSPGHQAFHSLQAIDPNLLLSSNDGAPGSEDYDGDYDNEDDEGTIHPFGPNVNPNKLLDTLTQQRQHNSNHKHSSSTSNSDNNSGTKVPIPGPPRDLEARIVNPRFVALSWLEPKINPDEVISYSVYYKMSTSDR